MFHTLAAISLLACAICPFVEIALHLNGSIFQNGHDTESTLALLLLLLELSFALGRLLVGLLTRVLKKLNLVYFCSERLTASALNFPLVLPEISPPLSLRI
ncbi:MAG TPA: hypothetical protein VHX36_09505 [Candidatus Acidoferrales bacterium]|nr:hypothetical protein [Candidatus Acidoferrales bacterium]